MKNQLRKQMKALKEGMTASQIEEYSRKIETTFLHTKEFIECETLFSYVAFNQEVETKEIIMEAFRLGKRVAVPKVTGKEIDFFYISSFDELLPGGFGILEPTSKEKVISIDETLMIMPGLAFDDQYNRLGYGAGYYDKYLACHEDKIFHKVAFAYDFQIVNRIETTSQDIKVDMIITPSRVI